MNTYLSWYKKRMPQLSRSDVLSLMCSSVSEPWDLLKKIHVAPSSKDFEKLYWTPNPYGHEKTQELIAAMYNVPENTVVQTQGATSAIFLLCQTFLSAGDHVVVENPGYEPLTHSPEACGAHVEYFNRNSWGEIDFGSLKNALKENTRLIILTDLHNPTGYGMTEDEVLKFATLATRISPDVKIILDEIYLDFVPDRRKPGTMIHPSIWSISSLTKVYGLSVLRCGWIIAVSEDLQRVRDRQVLISGIGSRYLESLSAQVLQNIDRFKAVNEPALTLNRRILKKYINEMVQDNLIEAKIPEYGCVVFPELKNCSNTERFTDFLENKFNLFCVPGKYFGNPKAIRLGIGEIHSDALKKALSIFKEALAIFR